MMQTAEQKIFLFGSFFLFLLRIDNDTGERLSRKKLSYREIVRCVFGCEFHI